MSEGAVIFAGGGTGGHIYPNIAIWERLKEMAPDVEAAFICSDRPADARALERVQAPAIPIPARPFGLAPWALVRLAANWGRCVRASRGVLKARRREGRSVQVVATGGYVSAPVVQAARVERIPVLAISLDAVPGRAARWTARRAQDALSAAATAPPGWERIGPIVRRAALPPAPPDECRRLLNLDPGTPTLLVTGGSQGARSVNEFLEAFARDGADVLVGWQVIHQTGADEAARARLEAAYADARVRARVASYLDPIGPAWGAASVAVARAGAGSVGEAWASETPTLFMPYPHHRDEHQAANAAALVEAGAALLATDQVDGARNAAGDAGRSLERLLTSESDRRSLRDSLRSLNRRDGADQAAARLAAACANAPI